MSSDSDSDSDVDQETEEVEDVTEEERLRIRSKLSTMSFEDLLKMREEVGAKVYNNTVLGVKKEKKKLDFRRANKNRPREMSSKIRVKTVLPTVAPVAKKQTARDPRFDPLCGQFEDKTFKTNYKFLHDVRVKEKDALEKELQDCKDPQRKGTIKYLLQRMENQIREQENLDKKHEKIREERREIKDKLKKGEKPVFKKKSVKKLESLIEKYEELKKTNKLQKHIEKRTKKLSQKEKKHDMQPV
ncbi:unnamed protein product [Brassicogethes aeneus]|uniref:rRNA biogenesis protein RRP36 n=1 Tax=Brassicogethes aeneus TaxID=1431903 RepID=A0A9P0FCV8_BRAAE|nr:unnamed protein product [Brassicogethes aeneus]